MANSYKNGIAALLIFVLLLGCANGSGNKNEEEQSTSVQVEKVTIGVTPWPASAAIFIAQEQDYFQEAGLEASLSSYMSGHMALDAALAGQVDLATASDTPIARAVLESKPLAVIATIAEIHNAIRIIARKDRNIVTAGDLRGKTIGLVAGTAADFFLHIFLATARIEARELRMEYLAADGIIEGLLSGQVDAVTTWAPHTITLRDQLGDNAVVLDDPSIYTMTWNIVGRQDFIANHPQMIEKFLASLLQANRFITERPEVTRAIVAQHIGTMSALYYREWPDYRFTTELGQTLILNLENQARWLRSRAGDKPSPMVNFLEVISAGGLRAVEPDGVKVIGK